MLITTGWKIALRFVATAVIFESALSFRQSVFQHQSNHVPRRGGISAPLKSCLGRGWLVPVRQAAGRGFRQGRREISPELQPSLVVMLGAAGAGADTTAGAGAAPGSSVDAARAAGDAPSPKAEAARATTAAGEVSRGGGPQQQHHGSDFLFEQKLESVRAALLCGSVGAASRLLAVGAGALIPGAFLRDWLATPEPTAGSLLFALAAGFSQGALFGLTYRYVVRSDRQKPNASGSGGGLAAATATTTATGPPVPQMDGFTVGHLGDGAVAAFALASAMGQSEVPLTMAAGEFVDVLSRGGGVVEAFGAVLLPAAPFLPRVAGDLFLYSAARAAIDRALDQGAIKPFP